MKKTVFFITLIFAALFVLLASITPTTAESGKDKEALEQAKKFVIGNNLGLIAMDYAHISSKDDEEIGFDNYEVYKKNGKISKVTRVWLWNSSDKVINVNPLMFKVVTENGYTIPVSSYTFQTKNHFPATSLEPDTKIDGFIVFELNMKDCIKKIIYDDGLGTRVEREYKDALILGFYEREFKKLP
ncbi:MAG: DUF4352 domain-containing protein [Proteobacteria bacterium]|nr:DUF4352 domain-containing protein [Pseudomonadota bacterium]MBU1387127.1 DUF4352 domain-containing protein [Pseudomonadota bacterium]MBU1541556.1 DUF4352 domain-containing protein [Pseudomonadota bacterium]MBU2429081.1 DUF4352 domain-containing protein [Pseudomonadota bacterium]MBU2482774.1 DUF4352 domain-containing protein [Pseudomonadota bacterium]